MFLALRELRFARGRFSLFCGVIALMTLMVVLLTGLTAGLGAASVSAVDALPGTALAFSAEPKVSFATSSVSEQDQRALAAKAGVHSATPIGVSTAKLTGAVAVLGGVPGSSPTAGGVLVPPSLGLATGSHVRVNDQDLVVTGSTSEHSLNHLPAVYVSLDTWRRVAHTSGATAILVDAEPGADLSSAGLTTLSRTEAYSAVGSYSSEQGSLNLMTGLLLGISALVVGAFFTVWTMQRGHDLAVVRAIGASRSYLLRDALGQAALVLVIGAGLGTALATGLGLAASTAVPFVLAPSTVLVPMALMVLVGLVGATFAVRRVTTVDPLTALGAAR
ncbi:ABC transporter permease [Kutzneria viridogrisea]|uniref:ABC3 transporter permease C-terminal domain-containing protein n=2 Tax=Kutzneria TaxID=43356 RepID=W5WJN8_9PSEU|nr:ABC transporter permease [Kutzneria albida]AHI00782.1 hypothetical protein KALB_7424 [Kutzneria albida DSM 43870]MBA8926058.1 putative ABC transport system permease protein [Kutzneria viridogrisea]